MEFIFLALVTVVLIVFFSALGARARTRDRLAKAFQGIARKHHGVYRRDGQYEQHVEFRRGEVKYRVELVKPKGWFTRAVTKITVSGWGTPGLEAMIRPRRGVDRFRFSTVRSGNFMFNLSFLVRGSSKERLQQLLSAGVIARLRSLCDIAHSRAFQVDLSPDGFVVTRKRWLLPFGFFDRYCDAVFGLCDEAVGVLAVGIDFSVPSSGAMEVAVCKICGDDLEAEIVYCRKCDTPHHKDCWAFNGECSTYACGERRFRRSKPSTLTVADR